MEQSKLIRSNSYIERKEFENGIQESILDDNCGVHVLWAPANFEKDIAVGKVSLNLQMNNIIDGVIYIKCDGSDKDFESLQRWLCLKLRIPNNQPLGDFIDRYQRILLIINNFDMLMNHDRYESFVTSLAEDSVFRKTYSVIILVDSDIYFKKILNYNHVQKVRPCFFALRNQSIY